MSDNFEKDSDSLWEKTKDTAGEAWEATKEFSGKAWDKTKEVSSDAWEATKNGAQKVSNAFSDDDEEVEKEEIETPHHLYSKETHSRENRPNG